MYGSSRVVQNERTLLNVIHGRTHDYRNVMKSFVLYEMQAEAFKDMAETCLARQRSGELTESQLQCLIDAFEVIPVTQRLLVVLSNLELYRNLHELNNLLKHANSLNSRGHEHDL
jgi:hypothetical protein